MTRCLSSPHAETVQPELPQTRPGNTQALNYDTTQTESGATATRRYASGKVDTLLDRETFGPQYVGAMLPGEHGWLTPEAVASAGFEEWLLPKELAGASGVTPGLALNLFSTFTTAPQNNHCIHAERDGSGFKVYLDPAMLLLVSAVHLSVDETGVIRLAEDDSLPVSCRACRVEKGDGYEACEMEAGEQAHSSLAALVIIDGSVRLKTNAPVTPNASDGDDTFRLICEESAGPKFTALLTPAQFRRIAQPADVEQAMRDHILIPVAVDLDYDRPDPAAAILRGDEAGPSEARSLYYGVESAFYLRAASAFGGFLAGNICRRDEEYGIPMEACVTRVNAEGYVEFAEPFDVRLDISDVAASQKFNQLSGRCASSLTLLDEVMLVELLRLIRIPGPYREACLRKFDEVAAESIRQYAQDPAEEAIRR